MLNKAMEKSLNDQINAEIFSFYLYLPRNHIVRCVVPVS